MRHGVPNHQRRRRSVTICVTRYVTSYVPKTSMGVSVEHNMPGFRYDSQHFILIKAPWRFVLAGDIDAER